MFSEYQSVKLSPKSYLDIDPKGAMYCSYPCLLDQDGVTSTIVFDSSAFKLDVSKSKPIEVPQIPIASPGFVRGSSFGFLKSPFTPSFGPPPYSNSCLIQCIPNSDGSGNQWRAHGNFYPPQNPYGNQPRCNKPKRLVPRQFWRSNYFQDVAFSLGSTYATETRATPKG